MPKKINKRKSRKKKGAGTCSQFRNNCSTCVNSNSRVGNKKCVFNRRSKECRQQSRLRTKGRGWYKTCSADDLPLARVEGVIVNPLRQESLRGTPYVNVDSEHPRQAPFTEEPVDAGISIEEQRQRVFDARRALRNRNGEVSNNSPLQGQPCFTPCKKLGWCEAGVTGACDRENYCYPANNDGTARMEGVDKQYCNKPRTTGGKRKSRRRKSRRRKSRRKKRKTRRKKR